MSYSHSIFDITSIVDHAQELDDPPFVIFGNWLKENYNGIDPPVNKIFWWQWWDNQGDVVINFDEVVGNIGAADMDASSEDLITPVNIHIFVRDYKVFSQRFDTNLTFELQPFDQQLNMPKKMLNVAATIRDLVNRNEDALDSQGIYLMEISDNGRQVPMYTKVIPVKRKVFHYVMQVRLYSFEQ